MDEYIFSKLMNISSSRQVNVELIHNNSQCVWRNMPANVMMWVSDGKRYSSEYQLIVAFGAFMRFIDNMKKYVIPHNAMCYTILLSVTIEFPDIKEKIKYLCFLVICRNRWTSNDTNETPSEWHQVWGIFIQWGYCLIHLLHMPTRSKRDYQTLYFCLKSKR